MALAVRGAQHRTCAYVIGAVRTHQLPASLAAFRAHTHTQSVTLHGAAQASPWRRWPASTSQRCIHTTQHTLSSQRPAARALRAQEPRPPLQHHASGAAPTHTRTHARPPPSPVEAQFMNLRGAAPLLSAYMRQRASWLKSAGASAASPTDTAARLVLAGVALARMAATARATSSADTMAMQSEAMRALLGDVAYMATASGHARTHAPDPRVAASILHALVKLRPTAAAAGGAELLAQIDSAFTAVEATISGRLAACPPRALAMYVWACEKRGWRLDSIVREVATVLTNRPALKAVFESSECAMLATAVASAAGRAGVATADVHNTLNFVAAAAVPLLPSSNHATLVSLLWAYATARYAHDGALRALAAELAERLRTWTSADPGVRTRTVPERAVPLSPRSLATALYCFGLFASSATTSSPHKSALSPACQNECVPAFLEAARYLTSISHESGSDEGGMRGFRDAGPGSDVADAPGDVAILSTFEAESIASIAWAFAKWHDSIQFAARRGGSMRTRAALHDIDALWATVQASGTNRVRAALARLARNCDDATDHRGPTTTVPSAREIRPSQIASIAWSLTAASVPAALFLTSALRHLSSAAAAYSVPAVAQLLWACAIQGVYDHAAFARAYEHVLAVAETEHWAASAPQRTKRRSPADALSIGVVAVPAGDDAERASSPAGVQKLQAQLYTSWMAWRLELEQGGANNSTAPIPEHVLTQWQHAYWQQEPRVSGLATRVARVLQSAGIEHNMEAKLPPGFRVDVFIPAANIALEVNGPVHYVGGNLLDNSHSSALVPDALDRARTPHANFTRASSRLGLDGTDPEDVLAPRTSNNSTVLVPTLRTRAKRRLLRAAGFKVVTINWREWEDAPSTQEQLELLADKGVPVPARLLSRDPVPRKPSDD